MDTKSLQNELDELASRYGISIYVFIQKRRKTPAFMPEI